jgi:ferredoxin-like protein FixX
LNIDNVFWVNDYDNEDENEDKDKDKEENEMKNMKKHLLIQTCPNDFLIK